VRAIPREVDDAIVNDAGDAYAFGLWCADGYWWLSSIGLSNVEPELILRFGRYLLRSFDRERLRLRIYMVAKSPPNEDVLALTDRISISHQYKMKRTAYHVYVNSRPLVRRFFVERSNLARLAPRWLGPYFAGRFDGDGTYGDTPRISYAHQQEAEVDAALLARAGVDATSVLYYRKANEYCIYIHRRSLKRFRTLVRDHSWKADRRFTL
jgi:hypothetical protein